MGKENSVAASAGTQKKTKILTKGFCILTIVYMFTCTSYQFLGNLYASFASEEAQLSPVAVGAIGGIIAMSGLCMRPFTAIIVDKINKKLLLMLACLMIGLSVFGFSLTISYNGLMAFQIIRGIGFALLTVTGYVLVSETVDKDNLSTAMSLYLVAQVIATSLSSMIAVEILERTNFQTTFRVGAIFALISVVLTFFIPLSNEKKADDSKQSFMEQVKSIRLQNIICIQILPIVLIGFMYQILQTSLGSYVIAFGREELNVANVGIFGTIANTIMWFTRPMLGRVADKYGARWTLIIGSIGFGGSCLILTQTNGTLLLIAAAIVYGVAAAGCMPVITSLCLKAVPENLKGSAASTRAIGADLGLITGNMIMPVIAASFGSYRYSYWLMVGIAILNIGFALAYFGYYNKKHKGNPLGW